MYNDYESNEDYENAYDDYLIQKSRDDRAEEFEENK